MKQNKKLKIAVSSVISWPYVRRGNRFAYELADYLSNQGHEVYYIATKPGAYRRRMNAGMDLEYHRLESHPFLSNLRVDKTETFIPSCLRSFFKGNFDVIQTTLNAEACAASFNKIIKGTPFVHILYGAEPLCNDIMLVRPLFRKILRSASKILVPSSYINHILEREFGIAGTVIHPPVDTDKFTPNYEKDLSPSRILCTCPLINPRKRVSLLVKAFERLVSSVPDAVLELAGQTDDYHTRNILLSVNTQARRRMKILNVKDEAYLASLYRDATISVVPSLNEPYGLVINESLASGTPVVGTRSGAVPEIIDSPDVGILFESSGNHDILCEALMKGLELAYKPHTSELCRKHAEKYSWKASGSLYEQLYVETCTRYGKRQKKQVRKYTESKMAMPKVSNGSELSGIKLTSGNLNRLFDDALDELEITYETYHEIDRHRPRCISVLRCLLSNKIFRGNILVIGFYTLPLTMFLGKYGFNVKGVEVTHNVKAFRELEDQIRFSDLDADEEQPRKYDVIICDDLLQYLVYPVRALQTLRDRLRAGGLFILSTPNVTRGAARLGLLCGKNIYPWLNEDLFEDIHRVLPYREYALNEVVDLISRVGFQRVRSDYIIGTKYIDSYFPMTQMPLKHYLAWKTYYVIQAIIPALRNYILSVASNSEKIEEGSEKCS